MEMVVVVCGRKGRGGREGRELGPHAVKAGVVVVCEWVEWTGVAGANEMWGRD